MIAFDARYVRGVPLQYFSTAQPQQLDQQLIDDRFPYFDRFETYHSNFEMSHDLIMPQSPTSSQSDSENSVSSIEISPKQIRPAIIKVTEVECRWKNCGLIFESLDLLASHVTKVHASSGPGGLFYCGWEGCSRNNRGFNARYKMLVHVRTHTNEKPHKCDQCDKSFSRAENLKIHTRSHSGEKPYVCPVPGCLKAYSNSSDRFKHTRTHQIDKPYQCKVPGCPKRYTDPSSLRKHVKTFKHFVSEEYGMEKATKTDQVVPKEGPAGDDVRYFRPHELTEKKIVSCPCSCPHSCCSLKAAEILQFGSLVNLRNPEIKHLQWNRLFLQEPNSYVSIGDFDDAKTATNFVEDMEIDAPLDLSITKKTICN